MLLRKCCSVLVPPNERVLSLACGLGDVLAAVKPAVGVGIGLCEEMANRARPRHPNLLSVEGEATQVKAEGRLDYALLPDFLNDVPDANPDRT